MKKHEESNHHPASTSFHEKSAWIILGATALVYIPYFIWVAANHAGTSPDLPVFSAGYLIAAFGMIIVTIAGHVAISVMQMRAEGEVDDECDERDDQIDLKANRIARWVSDIGLFAALGLLATEAAPFWIAHWVLLTIVAGTLVYFGAKIIAYRSMR